MLSLRAFKFSLVRRLSFSHALPLTERNVLALNRASQPPEEEYFGFFGYDAGHYLQRAREVQISEWLRLIS